MNEEVAKENEKPKTKARAGLAHGMIEGEKRQMSNESGPA